MWLRNVCSIFFLMARTLSSCWKLRKCNVRSLYSSENVQSFPVKCNNISERRFSWKHFHWARSTVTTWLVVNGDGAEIAHMLVTELASIKHLTCLQRFIFFDIKTSHGPKPPLQNPRDVERMENYSLLSVTPFLWRTEVWLVVITWGHRSLFDILLSLTFDQQLGYNLQSSH